ncbi:ATP-dependent DNA helicase DDM1 [Acorus gramineus]|uniref:ATP-dependent DNA helicase DDM1 n=1 Tax=Acorus gramineus TaxID=55184 RepID=A0AAV9BE44_ACOGR|nr:ATP-dependent DNA helicase DDM1 [Acorus gramineus]
MAETEVKNEAAVDSPTSVLGDEDICKAENVPFEEEILQQVGVDNGVASKEEAYLLLDAVNGDSSFISKAMAVEEVKLEEGRAKDEEKELSDREKVNGTACLTDERFSKLDELLTQTQMYSEFLLEKMDDITFTSEGNKEEEMKEKKGGRGNRKRKATTQYNRGKVKTAVEAMFARSQEGRNAEDVNLTEEERVAKEQAELVPALTGGKLKSYQLKGVKWLISLWQNGLNGILADQMGLGKTIQTIAFLAHLKGKGLFGPYLIIAPLSTLSNWVNEVSRFAPSISTVIYHGSKKERQDIRNKFMPKTVGPKFPLIITSYEVVLNDAKVLSRYNWKFVVVDEGHRLKNSKCKLLRELRRLPIENKLLLTGTPLQNNLPELWSLLNFILPDIFSSLEEFESWFDLSGKFSSEAEQEEMEEKRRLQVVSKLHSILRPFLLRRLKEDVEQLLPRKKEIILYANMSDCQKNFQEHLINRTLENYLMEKDHCFGGVMTRKLNNLCVQLRKNCNHPDLLESAYDGSFEYPPVQKLVEQCGKFRLLERLLAILLARKHKIQEFNDLNSTVSIFLLSTRAGGLGINLTAADTCIIYDSDWGRMVKRAFGKLKLEHVVIATGQFQQERNKSNTLEEAELLALLRDEVDEEDKLVQTDICDEDLLQVLDRSDLIDAHATAKDGVERAVSALPLKGPGWEVVLPARSGGGVLSSVSS